MILLGLSEHLTDNIIYREEVSYLFKATIDIPTPLDVSFRSFIMKKNSAFRDTIGRKVDDTIKRDFLTSPSSEEKIIIKEVGKQ